MASLGRTQTRSVLPAESTRMSHGRVAPDSALIWMDDMGDMIVIGLHPKDQNRKSYPGIHIP